MTRTTDARRVVMYVSLVLALTVISSLPYLSPPVTLREGMVSPYDVAAPRGLEFVNPERTEELRRRTVASIPPAYRANPGALAEAERSVRGLAESILAFRADAALSAAAMRSALTRLGLLDEARAAAESLARAEIDAARDLALRSIHETMATGVRPEDLPAARVRADDRVRELPHPAAVRSLARHLAVQGVRPTLVVDPEVTRAHQEAAALAVEPVRERILRDEIIVRRGDVVTAAQLRRLQVLGVVTSPQRWESMLGTLLLMSLLVAVIGAYLWKFQPEIWNSDRQLVLLAVILLVTVLGTRILAARLSGLLVPVAAATMLVTILINPRVGSFTGGVLAILTGIVGGGDLRLAIVSYVGALTGVFGMRRIQRRTDLALAGTLVGLANAAAIVATDLIARNVSAETLTNAGQGVLNGLLAGILTIGALPYLEDAFGLVTPIKLLELSIPSHPLLRRLQLETPGTYNHTTLVANLAEAAAEAVGADALLARVGSYYHDVGKIRRPGFFVENQIGGRRNPHDRMQPSLSALAIAAHVRDGLEFARQYRLPKAIADFIPEHHGTSLIAYFYHRAVERAGGEPVDPQAYRYEGPRPRSKETAIVMLADSTEGAARSLGNPQPDRIHDVVRRIVREKLEDGQLDECDLTFRDLDRIETTFTRILTSMFHPRIEYPEVTFESRRAAPAHRFRSGLARSKRE
jgi:putative nucleotidyltransferase with HDIG domain